MKDDLITLMVARRNAALLSLNATQIMDYMEHYNPDEARRLREHLQKRPEVFWASVHKARCQVTTFPRKVYNESAQWLKEHNFNVPPRPAAPSVRR